MTRKFAVLAAAIVAFAFTAQAANAGHRRHIDHRIKAVAIGVGAASTAAFFALNDWHWKWDSARNNITSLGAWGATTLGCAAVSPMVATVVLNRPLSNREAGILIGSCVVPIVGGWLVNEAYAAHPEWESPPPVERVAYRKKHRAMK
jgi:hypothetical protein